MPAAPARCWIHCRDHRLSSRPRTREASCSPHLIAGIRRCARPIRSDGPSLGMPFGEPAHDRVASSPRCERRPGAVRTPRPDPSARGFDGSHAPGHPGFRDVPGWVRPQRPAVNPGPGARGAGHARAGAGTRDPRRPRCAGFPPHGSTLDAPPPWTVPFLPAPGQRPLAVAAPGGWCPPWDVQVTVGGHPAHGARTARVLLGPDLPGPAPPALVGTQSRWRLSADSHARFRRRPDSADPPSSARTPAAAAG